MQDVVRNKRKERKGVVIADKMDKTITVQVERLDHHPWFGKTLRKYSSFKVHDEKNEAKVGDFVKIAETRPLSKTKRWRLVKVLKSNLKFKNQNPK